MRGEEPAAMLPEPRPDAFAVSLRNRQVRQGGAREKPKSPFPHRGRERQQSGFQLEQKHEPMSAAGVAVFTDESGQVKIPSVDPTRSATPTELALT